MTERPTEKLERLKKLFEQEHNRPVRLSDSTILQIIHETPNQTDIEYVEDMWDWEI